MAFFSSNNQVVLRLRRIFPIRWSYAPDVILALLLAIVAIWPVLQVLRVAFARMNYPFELEWMEGGIVDHIRIVLSGQSLYREPSLDFTPFIYVPGYYYVSAVVTKIVGVGFLAPRLVSTLSILGCFILLAQWVHKETRSLLAALVTTGLFAATYGQSEFWFDIGRIDSLFLYLLLAGYYFARFGSTRRHSILCGGLLAFAALTKQVGLVLAAPALGYILLQSWKRGLWAFASYCVFVISAFGILEVTSHGWFSFYVFRLPADHELLWPTWRTIVQNQFWAPVAPMMLAAFAVVLWLVPRFHHSLWAFYATWVLVAVGTAFSSILHTGGYPNVLMPAHAALATCAGLVFASLWQTDEKMSQPFWKCPGSRLFAMAAVVIQMALLPEIRPQNLIPSAEDRATGSSVLSAIKASPGPVWMISSGYYPLLTHGVGVSAHAMGFVDIFKSRQEAIKQHLMNTLLTRIREKRFRTIVLDRAGGFLPNEITHAIHQHYQLKQRLLQPQDGRFWPKSGASIRPDEIWEPR